MRKQLTVLALVLTLVLAGSFQALAAADMAAALDYLKTQQGADGGFGSGLTPGSSISATADAIMAIMAAGGDPNTFDKGGSTPVTYLSAQASSAATGGDLSKLILAVVALGEDPRQFGGIDAVAKLEALSRPSGLIGGETDTFFSHCLAVLALVSAGRPVSGEAAGAIKVAQQDNGGWAWDGSSQTQADTNTTALAVQALAAIGDGSDNQVIDQAMAYYKSIQNADGGWPYQSPSQFGTATDANSTAVTIQAILAAGEDPAGADWQSSDGQTPMAALEALQTPNGGVAWQATVPGDNLLATFQALPALAGKPFPLARLEAAAPAATSAPTSAVDVAATAAQATPSIVPTSGGRGSLLPLAFMLAGAALLLGSFTLSRRRA